MLKASAASEQTCSEYQGLAFLDALFYNEQEHVERMERTHVENRNSGG